MKLQRIPDNEFGLDQVLLVLATAFPKGKPHITSSLKLAFAVPILLGFHLACQMSQVISGFSVERIQTEPQGKFY